MASKRDVSTRRVVLQTKGSLSRKAAPASVVPASRTGSVLSLCQKTITPCYLITLAAFFITISRTSLGPVYGSEHVISSSVIVTYTSLLVGFIGYSIIPHVNDKFCKAALAIAAFSVPSLQDFVCRYSRALGPSTGSLVTSLIAIGPLLSLCSYRLCLQLENFRYVRRTTFEKLIVLCSGAYLVLTIVPQLQQKFASLLLKSQYFSTNWLELGLASTAIFQAPVEGLVGIVPVLMYTLQQNRHLHWARADKLVRSDLRALNWTLIARKESMTGYISVLENLNEHYRVLRCDHALLGGEWKSTDELRSQGSAGTEPVYAVFQMLEAVRLIETSRTIPNSDRPNKALVIGLGVGTASKALAAHGIDTETIELDPVVHEFAKAYFHLPRKHHSVILGNALEVVDRLVLQSSAPLYRYIVHDVFTSGGEALALFSTPFLTQLRHLLHPEGSIAINFAGQIGSRPTIQVMNTISRVFNGRCRIFRELEADPLSIDVRDGADFANLVVFCLHPRSSMRNRTPLFRRAQEKDYLGSLSRREHLEPNPSNELQFPSEADMRKEKFNTVEMTNIQSFLGEQRRYARMHWRIMRETVPDIVWQSW